MGQAVHAFELATERRENTRVDIHLLVKVVLGPTLPPAEGVLVNIATDGMFVQAPTSPPCGASVSLHFRMLAKRVCEARGHVVWQRHSGFGVSFEDRNPALETFVNELKKLPMALRQIYLADVLHPRIRVSV